MVSVPVLVAPVLATMVNVVVPSPVPLAPAPMLSHGALLVAVQAHPAGAVTVTDGPEPPDAPAEWDVGLIS
jgi:hypothetical protein